MLGPDVRWVRKHSIGVHNISTDNHTVFVYTRGRIVNATSSLEHAVPLEFTARLASSKLLLAMLPLPRVLVGRTAQGLSKQRRAALGSTVGYSARIHPLPKSKQFVGPPVSRLSTMSGLKGAAAALGGKREYDPEIKDIASYVHNHEIDSELAVSDFLMIVIKLTGS